MHFSAVSFFPHVASRIRAQSSGGLRGSLGVIAFASALLPVHAYAQKSTIQPADIVQLKKVADPVVSPDGKLVAYTVEIPVPAGLHRNAHIWLAPATSSDAGRPFAYSGAAEDSPAWSPDGAHLAFLSNRPNPLAQGESSPYRFSLAPGSERKDIPSPLVKAVPDAKPDKDAKPDVDPDAMQLWWISLSGGELTVRHKDAKPGFLGFGRSGIFTFTYASIANARVFFLALEKLMGYRFST